uniref:Uncharacterized protein n=1 Tax=Anguilla anguilla TaxID=7936 RepID=A0A0E9XUL5_ANGAN
MTSQVLLISKVCSFLSAGIRELSVSSLDSSLLLALELDNGICQQGGQTCTNESQGSHYEAEK